MNPYLETLQTLQRQLQTGSATDLAELRARVPAPVLAHFDRLIAQRRKAVAEVSHGVCGACHLRLPLSVVTPGSAQPDLQLCENCGAYLILPGEDGRVEVPIVRSRRRYRAMALA